MFATLVIGGGVLCTGFSAYQSWKASTRQRQDHNRNLWQKVAGYISNRKQAGVQNDILESANDIILANQASRQQYQIDSVDLYVEQSRTLEQQIILATTALGFTAIGSLTVAPLYLASIPILVYMGVPAAQDAYDELAQSRRPGLAVLETGLLLIVLAQGTYMVGALGFAAYYFGQLKNLLSSPLQIDMPIEISVWRGGKKMQVLIGEVEKGDLFEVATSDQVHVDGIIIDGEAVVDLQWATGEEELVTKKAGERILATTVISVGKLVVECR